MSLRPNYQLYVIPLTTAGRQDIAGRFTYCRVVDARDASNSLALSAAITIRLSRTVGDAIPMGLNGLVKMAGATELIRVEWAAQAGVSVTLLLSDQDSDDGVSAEAPPARQIVTASFGTTLATSRVNVTNVATQLDATANPQSRTIRNRDAANSIFVGGSNAVTTAAGFEVPAGGSLVIDHTTSALWAIALVAGPTSVDVLVEV